MIKNKKFGIFMKPESLIYKIELESVLGNSGEYPYIRIIENPLNPNPLTIGFFDPTITKICDKSFDCVLDVLNYFYETKMIGISRELYELLDKIGPKESDIYEYYAKEL